MNIAVISPDNRGTGVTSLTMVLGAALKNKGMSVVVTSISDGHKGLRKYIGSIKKDAESVTGMKDMLGMVQAGTLEAKDISSYCVNRGIDILPRTDGMSGEDVAKVIDFIGKSSIEGRQIFTLVDVDIDNMASREVGLEIKNCDAVVVVETQSVAHLDNFKANRQNMAKAFQKKKVFVVVNFYDKFAGTVKDIWKQAGMSYGDGWYEVRYNKCVNLMTAKTFMEQLTEAMKDATDPDVATLKADLDKIALALMKRGK